MSVRRPWVGYVGPFYEMSFLCPLVTPLHMMENPHLWMGRLAPALASELLRTITQSPHFRLGPFSWPLQLQINRSEWQQGNCDYEYISYGAENHVNFSGIIGINQLLYILTLFRMVQIIVILYLFFINSHVSHILLDCDYKHANPFFANRYFRTLNVNHSLFVFI